jgi:hypothetical protein
MALRQVEVPDGAPPYDCEAHGTACPAVRAVGAVGAVAGGAHEADGDSRSVPVAASRSVPVAASRSVMGGGAAGAADPVRALPWQFAQVIVEIMAGLRPPKQLIGLTTERARAQVQRLAPLLASDRRPKIARIVTSRPTAGAVEMTVIVRVGPRSRALAVRLEHLAARPATPGRPARSDRWLCTAVEAG